MKVTCVKLPLGVFQDLLRLQVKDGDHQSLKQHFEGRKKNATYLSPRIQNEIIHLCGEVIRDEIIKNGKDATSYSLMGDESRGIAVKNNCRSRFGSMMKRKSICEEFVGFIELDDAMDDGCKNHCLCFRSIRGRSRT